MQSHARACRYLGERMRSPVLPFSLSPTPRPVVVSATEYDIVIGLEVHAQLLTATKAFSPESAAFGAEPNADVDPVSLGHRARCPCSTARSWRRRCGWGSRRTARSPSGPCSPARLFYPDLPKGYQISQFETPICEGGYVEIEAEVGGKADRAHADPHGGGRGQTRPRREPTPPSSTSIARRAAHRDRVRAGPAERRGSGGLPSRDPADRPIPRHLRRQHGGGIPLRRQRLGPPARAGGVGTKAEIKNLNSIRNVERAIAFEAERQTGWSRAGEIVQETRLWDADAS